MFCHHIADNIGGGLQLLPARIYALIDDGALFGQGFRLAGHPLGRQGLLHLQHRFRAQGRCVSAQIGFGLRADHFIGGLILVGRAHEALF